MFAEYEVRQGGQRVAMGMNRKAELGGTPMKPPIGYLNYRDPSAGRKGLSTVVIDQERAPLVQWAFEAFAKHEWSISRLVDELDERGLRSKPHRRDGLPRPLKKNEVHRMLRNRYYLGIVTYKGEEYEGKHEPLIGSDLFDRVQELLTSRNVSGSRYRAHDHYLKGVLFCGECGGRFYISNIKNRHGTTYHYFLCRGRQLRSCTMRHVKVSEAEALVEGLYDGMTLPPDRLERVHTMLRADIERLEAEARTVVTTQEARLRRLHDEETKNAHAYQADALSLDVLKAENERITKERRDARRVIAKAEVRFGEAEPVIQQALKLASRLEDAYRTASPKVRRIINQVLFERVETYNDWASQTLTEAFETLYEVAGHNVGAAGPRYDGESAHYYRQSGTTNPGKPSASRGLRKHLLVELVGQLSNQTLVR